MAHQEARALHPGYAENGDNAALRKVAATAVPIVRCPIDLLARLPKGCGARARRVDLHGL